VTNYLWDELSQYGDVVLETDASGAALASYVLAGPELIYQRRAGSTSYYLHDGQGSVRALSDGTGAFTDEYTYTGFGELLAQQGTTENPYLYAGQRFDDLIGLYQMRARYYDPAGGRFLSRDPYEGNMTSPLEINRYIYAANNPVNLSDPSGTSVLMEYVKAVSLPAAALGAPAGGVGGILSAQLMQVVMSTGFCGPEAQAFAYAITVDTTVASIYYGMAFALGAGFGGLFAGLIAYGPGGMIVAGAIMYALGFLGFAIGEIQLIWDLLAHGFVNVCALIQMILSVVAMYYGLKFMIQGYQMWLDGKQYSGGTSTSDDGAPEDDGSDCPGCDSDDGIRPPRDLGSNEGFSEEEAGTADYYRSLGDHMEKDPQHGTPGHGDALRNGDTVEIKNPRPGADSRTIINEVNRGIKRQQGPRYIIDTRGCGTSRDEAARGLVRTWGAYNRKLEWVRAIGDGFHIGIDNRGTVFDLPLGKP
jgi:RHS repeat-associated protein